MSATYDSTLPNDRNYVRFLINDTVPLTAIFQDEEIDAVLIEESARISVADALKYFAAARLIDRLHLQLAAGGTKHGGAMAKRVDDLARSFGVAASTSAALDEKARDLRREGARRLRTRRGFFFRAMAITAILIAPVPSAESVAQTIYSWLPFLPPVANSAALPTCADNTLTEKRMITTLSPAPGSLYICPDGGGAWACLVGQDCPSTGSVTSVGLTMPSGFTVTGSPITGSGTLAATITGTITANISGSSTDVACTNCVALGTETTGGYAGSASEGGPATTALALNANPTGCDVGDFVTDIAADGTLTCDAVPAGVTDHGGLTGLSDDDHTQYGLLSGRSGGQIIAGGTDAGDLLTLWSTSHASRGRAVFDTAGVGVTFYVDNGTDGGKLVVTRTDIPSSSIFLQARQSGTSAPTLGSTTKLQIQSDGGNSALYINTPGIELRQPSVNKTVWVRAGDDNGMLQVQGAADGSVGGYVYIVPTDTAPTCDRKGIQWERSSVDALCRCNGSTWDKLAGADSCP